MKRLLFLGAALLLAASPAFGQPPAVEVAVQVIEIRPHPADQGLVARLESDVRRMLHRSRRVVLRETQYHLVLGQTTHLLLPNGCEAAITPLALEANDFVRLHVAMKAPTQFDLELSVKSGGRFNVGAGRSTNGHLLLLISPHGP